MGLGLFKLTGGAGAFSKDHTFSNPVLWESSPTGGVLEARYFLRMEDANVEYCTSGKLFAVDESGTDESGWMDFAPDNGGLSGTYDSIFDFEIPLGSEVKVWVRITVPQALEVEPKDDIRIAATYIGFHT